MGSPNNPISKLEGISWYIAIYSPLDDYCVYPVFFGLQYILKKWLVGTVVTQQMIDQAEAVLARVIPYSNLLHSWSTYDLFMSFKEQFMLN